MGGIAGYTLEREIFRGHGWLARDAAGRRVVVRAFPGRDPALVKDVGTLCGLVSDPRLVHAVAHGIDPARGPYLVRPWVDGETLAERGSMPGHVARRVLASLADALRVVHGFGLAHGKVDPRHVVLEGGLVTQVRLLDLGVALLDDDAGGVAPTGFDLTRPGAGLEPSFDFEGLARLAGVLTRDQTVREVFEAARTQPDPLTASFEALARARPSRARGPSLLVEDLDVPPTGGAPLEVTAASELPGQAELLEPLRAESFEARYRVQGEIARGGMGAILAARDRRLGRDLVLKVLHEAEAAPAGLLARFVEEAKIQGQLEHPNICPIHELGLDADGEPYFAMKRVKGRALSDVLEAEDRPPLERLLEVFLRVCDAMASAHAQGVVHRDLKPDNVMVGEFGEVLVMDWGIAKVVGREQASIRGLPRLAQPELHTSPGAAMGTPHYMPPEQAQGDPDIDTRADVYALGGVLYTILTGSRPVQGASLPALLVAVMRGQIEPPSQRAPDRRIPKDLEAACLRALATRREDRYPSAQALAADVRAYLDGRTLEAAEYTPAERLAKWYGRNRLFARMALLVTLSVAVGAGLFFTERLATRAETARLAEKLVAEGRLASEADDWLDAKRAFADGRDKARQVGLPTGRADFGLWQLRRWVPEPALAPVRTGTIADLVFLDEGRYATASGPLARVRETTTGRVQRTFTSGGPLLEGLAASPGGRRLVGKLKGDGFVVWDTVKGVRLRGVPARHVRDYALLSEDRLLYTTRTGALRLVDLSDPGRAVAEVEVGAGWLHVGAGGALVLVGRGIDARVFSGADLRGLGSYVFLGAASASAVSADGGRWIEGDLDGRVWFQRFELWDAKARPPVERVGLRRHRARVVEIDVAPASDRVLTVDADGRGVVWVAGAKPRAIAALEGSPGGRLRLSPDGRFVLRHDGTQVWLHPVGSDPTRVEPAAELDWPSGRATFSPDGRRLLVPSEVGLQVLWGERLEPFGLVRERFEVLPGFRALLRARRKQRIVLDPTGRWSLTIGPGGAVLRPALGGEPAHLLETMEGAREVGVAPTGRHVLFEDEKGGVVVLDVETKASTRVAGARLGRWAAFGPEGRQVALHKRFEGEGGGYGPAIFDLEAGRVVARFPVFTRSVSTTAFSPDGTRLYAADQEGRVLELDVADERAPRVVLEVNGFVGYLAESRDGRWLAAGEDTGRVFLFDRRSREQVGVWSVEDEALEQMVFHPTQATLLVQELGGQPRLLRIAPEVSPEPTGAWARAARLIEVGLEGLGCRSVVDAQDAPADVDPTRLLPCAEVLDDPSLGRRLVEQAGRRGLLEPSAVAALLEGPAPARGVDTGGRSPLMRAAAAGRLDTVRALLRAGADPNQRTNEGTDTLTFAALGGDPEIVRALLAAGADPRGSLALDGAVQSRDTLMLSTLLESGFDPAPPHDPRGHVVRHAARTGREAALQVAIRLTQPSAQILSAALDDAMLSGAAPDVVERLLAAGASPEGQGRSRRPLYSAVAQGQVVTAGRLLAAGAKLDVPDPIGVTPFEVALEGGDVELVAVLLEAGADPDRALARGRTPLTFAIERGADDVLQLLLSARADPSRPDGLGRTPAAVAVAHRNPTALSAVLDAGASANEVVGDQSLLLHATRLGHRALVEALLRQGARDRPGPDGVLALDEARRLGRLGIVRRLEAVRPPPSR